MSNNNNNVINNDSNKDKKYIRKSSFKSNDKDYFKRKLNKMHTLSFNLSNHNTYFVNNNNNESNNKINENDENNNNINKNKSIKKRFVKMKTYTKPFSNYIALSNEDKIKKISEMNKESSKRLIKYRNIFEKIKNEIKGIDETFNRSSLNNDDDDENNNKIPNLKKSCNTYINHKKSNLKNKKFKYKHQKSISSFSQSYNINNINNNKIDFDKLNIPNLNFNETIVKKKSNKKITFQNDLNLDSKNCDANLDLNALNEGKKTIRLKDNKNELLTKINFRSNVLNNSNRFNSIDTNASNNNFLNINNNNDGKFFNKINNYKNNKKYAINYNNINTQTVLESENYNNNNNCCKNCECKFQ